MPKDNKKTRILITGINSYIGNYFEIFIKENYREKFIITKISLRDDNWKDMDFSIYDCILHVAGIAHQDDLKQNKTIQNNTIQYNTIQYNTIQYNTIQYNTIQYNTIQYNTIQYKILKISIII